VSRVTGRQARWCTATLLVACAGPALSGETSGPQGDRQHPTISSENWVTHPTIKATRSLVEANEAAIRSGRWKREEKPVCDPPALETQRIVFRDSERRIRKFVSEGGSDDSAYRLEHQYDEHGRLRFAFGRSGGVSDTVVEHRLYFAENGTLLWKDRRQLGPGYTFLDDWPEEYLVRDPARAFDAPKQCK
jgi:hypothetical protein